MIKLQILVGKCKVPTQFNCSYFIKAKFNHHFSNISASIFPELGVLVFNEKLTINLINTQIILEDDKCQIEIYEEIKNQLVGRSIVYIRDRKLKQNQQYDKYKVQECSDNKAYCEIMLYMRSGKQQKAQKKISLVLNKKLSLRRSVGEQKQRDRYRKANSFTDRQRLQTYSSQKKQQKLQQLNETVNFLKRLLTIEQSKNQKSNRAIQQLMRLIGISHQELLQGFISNQNDQQLANPNLDQINEKKDIDIQQQQMLRQKYDILSQRVEYLQQKSKKLQNEKQKFFSQVQELRTKLQNIEDSQQRSQQIAHLREENQQLKQYSHQMERKVKETLKAMQSFKKQALVAREQLIQKQSIVEQLTKKHLIHQNINPQNKMRTKSLFQPSQSIQLSKLICSTLKNRQILTNQLKLNQLSYTLSTLGPKINTIKNRINIHYNQLVKGKLSTQSILKSRSQVLSIVENQLISGI